MMISNADFEELFPLEDRSGRRRNNVPTLSEALSRWEDDGGRAVENTQPNPHIAGMGAKSGFFRMRERY